MAFLTKLVSIQSIAQGDKFIQGVTDTDPVYVASKETVENLVSVQRFGKHTETAQRYLMAHFLSLAKQNSGGRGPLSSESIGGIARSYTLPYLNQTSVIASTQYGLMFLEIQNRVTVAVMVI